MTAARKAVLDVAEAARSAGATLIAVPDAWLARVDRKRSVFDSLYRWLMATHGAADAHHTLHNRTYVGRELMKRLRAAEHARLRTKRPRLSAADLERAVSWADLNSGPHSMYDGHSLRGDGLFFVRENAADFDRRVPAQVVNLASWRGRQ